MNIIEIDKLSHRFSNGFLGLDSIDLSVKKGEFVVIAGRKRFRQDHSAEAFERSSLTDIGNRENSWCQCTG